jgi:hypothetical protein
VSDETRRRHKKKESTKKKEKKSRLNAIIRYETLVKSGRHLPGDLVSELLARDDGDLLADALVGVKVQSETSVVLFDEGLGRLLDGLGSNASLYAHDTKKCD